MQMEREGVCGGELQIPCVFRSFSRFGLPCNDWGLGCLGSSSGENQVERVVRLVVLIQQLVNMFDTLMMFEHIVCWTQSERGKPGNLDHLHSLRLHRRAPWLAGGLLCHRVSPFKTIFSWQPLIGLVAWSGLFSGSSWWRTPQPRWVSKSLFSSCCDPKFSAPVYICWGEETHHGVHRKGDKNQPKK